MPNIGFKVIKKRVIAQTEEISVYGTATGTGPIVGRHSDSENRSESFTFTGVATGDGALVVTVGGGEGGVHTLTFKEDANPARLAELFYDSLQSNLESFKEIVYVPGSDVVTITFSKLGAHTLSASDISGVGVAVTVAVIVAGSSVDLSTAIVADDTPEVIAGKIAATIDGDAKFSTTHIFGKNKVRVTYANPGNFDAISFTGIDGVTATSVVTLRGDNDIKDVTYVPFANLIQIDRYSEIVDRSKPIQHVAFAEMVNGKRIELARNSDEDAFNTAFDAIMDSILVDTEAWQDITL